jgi:hypothetical protein
MNIKRMIIVEMEQCQMGGDLRGALFKNTRMTMELTSTVVAVIVGKVSSSVATHYINVPPSHIRWDDNINQVIMEASSLEVVRSIASLINHKLHPPWDLNKDPCTYHGLACDERGALVAVVLAHQYLGGSFHVFSGLQNLSTLQLLDLSG